ncbi:MAG: Hsp20/alpha crystallin family protein [Phycisphaeraceae bacterium]|nr:Hsp20/alpha crystallin family protein [Phycisphaerae bacterium]MBX3392869.1 Hsp20/alpha crystallin family protein [Phycisphaeraceae bacterium]HRJ49850.1 Hsp20/alpha crystallin family protein [Phycisphaerales bacterium]
MNSIIRSGPFTIPGFDRLVSQVLSDPFFAEGRIPGGSLVSSIDEGALALDVSEDDQNVYVRASLPGFRKEDVEISVHDGVLSIKAEHSEETEEKKERYYRRERRVGSVSRRIALPSSVQEDKTSAQLSDGVLTLSLPKHPKDEPRRIAIR